MEKEKLEELKNFLQECTYLLFLLSGLLFNLGNIPFSNKVISLNLHYISMYTFGLSFGLGCVATYLRKSSIG
jgi:hypothetical protein